MRINAFSKNKNELYHISRNFKFLNEGSNNICLRKSKNVINIFFFWKERIQFIFCFCHFFNVFLKLIFRSLLLFTFLNICYISKCWKMEYVFAFCLFKTIRTLKIIFIYFSFVTGMIFMCLYHFLKIRIKLFPLCIITKPSKWIKCELCEWLVFIKI